MYEVVYIALFNCLKHLPGIAIDVVLRIGSNDNNNNDSQINGGIELKDCLQKGCAGSENKRI